ncbi:hypothetical protein Tco_1282199 [Tanacetum coccineum]
MNSSFIVSKIHRTNLNGLRRSFQLLKVVQKPLLKGIDNDIYSTFDACPNACEMWKAIERFVTLVKQSQELKTVSYHKLYDILKQHQNEFNEIRAKILAHIANLIALVAQQQPVYHPQNHPNHYTQNSSPKSQQDATRNRGKAIVNSSTPTYDQEPFMVADDDEKSKVKEIDKLMALISLSFKKIYKPTNNNLRTSSNTSRANQDNTWCVVVWFSGYSVLILFPSWSLVKYRDKYAVSSLMDTAYWMSEQIYRGTGYDNQKVVNVVGARENVGTHVVQQSRIKCYNCKEYRLVAKECQKPKWTKDATYHKEKMLFSHYMYIAQIQEVTPDVADNYGPIFDIESLLKVQNDDDNYNVFANDREHHVQPESINDTYLEEQSDTHIAINSLDMSTNGETVDQDDDDLAKERDLLASLIKKLKCEIDDSKNRNKFLESSNKTLVDKLKGEIEDFKIKNKSLELSNNHFKEANNELSKTNQLMFKDLKKF